MILRPDQFDAIRARDFDHSAGFLGRLAEALREFIAADGMLAAGESVGPMTELRQNGALLAFVLDRARALTTVDDQSRAPGILRLARVLEELGGLCRRKAGITLAELEAQFVAAEADEAPAEQGSEAEQIEVRRASILQSLVTQEEELRRLALHASVEPLNEVQLPRAINVWQCAARTMIRITGLSPLDLTLLELLEHLGDALDEVKDLLFRHGVDKAALDGCGQGIF